ncbi:MAG TPA: AraC family transcriptional regulator [Chryseolinea sp.]
MEAHQRQFILSLLGYAVQKGVSPQPLCKQAQVNLEALQKGKAAALTPKQTNDLWLHASRLCNDPLFGLHFGESLQLAALGVVGQIIQASNTVGDALTIANSLSYLVTDLFTMNVKQGTKTFSIQLVPRPQAEQEWPFLFTQLRDMLMVFIIHELDGLLLVKIHPTAVKFPYPNGTDLTEYERVLRCKPSRKGDAYALEFDKRYWNEPILTANYELQSLLLKTVNRGAPTLKSKPSLQNRIHEYLMANAYLGILSLDDVASNFNVSTRSLQRKLKEENITFQELADAVRKALAVEYIKKGDHPIKEISHMLGYNELSAFSRAFKRWTGKTPSHLA